MPRRKRRHFTPEQKADAVRLAREAGGGDALGAQPRQLRGQSAIGRRRIRSERGAWHGVHGPASWASAFQGLDIPLTHSPRPAWCIGNS
jgi:transposase-like protein